MRRCHGFFEKMYQLGLVVTFDEVRLKSGYSEVGPDKVSLETKFSRNVDLKIPIVSAAMDTVTEARLAIALAKLGGLGVIHKNLSPEEQKEHLRRVKFHLSGKIARPITVQETETLEEVERRRREKGYAFWTFPVLDAAGRLAGVLTQNDFDFSADRSRKVGEVMTRESLVFARPETTLDEAYEMMRKNKKKVLPLVDHEGKIAGMYLFRDLERVKSGASHMYNVDADGRLRAGIAVGVLEDAFERVDLMHEYADVVVIDTAHGDSRNVRETLRELKGAYGNDLDIVAGNVSEGESAVRLAEWGADGIKVGQGPGSICTTRIVAGIGCAQVSAVYFVTRALENAGHNVPVCADGGIVYSGDIPIAIGAGAETVMVGKMLAGTAEAPGDVDYRGPVPVKTYRGMGSLAAMAANQGSRDRYQETGKGRDMIAEGVEAQVPFVGSVADAVNNLVGGLRRGMGYVGAATIGELREKADFHRSTSAGMRENHPHDVKVRVDSRRDA